MADSKYPQKIKSGETPMIQHSSSSFTFDKDPIEESPWVELSDKLVETAEKLREAPTDIGCDIDALLEAANLIKDARGFDIEDTQHALIAMTEDRDEILVKLTRVRYPDDAEPDAEANAAHVAKLLQLGANLDRMTYTVHTGGLEVVHRGTEFVDCVTEAASIVGKKSPLKVLFLKYMSSLSYSLYGTLAEHIHTSVSTQDFTEDEFKQLIALAELAEEMVQLEALAQEAEASTT